MLVLALESSAGSASCAVCAGEKLLGQYYQNNKLTHSRTLLTMAQSLLMNLDVSTAEIRLIAVARGPGSFTGVRIGVAAAKGLAWGLNVPVCGVSTLYAMVHQTPEPNHILCPVMDARRGQVYNALFRWSDGSYVRICDDRALSLEALSSELASLHTPCLLLGDGSEISLNYLTSAGVSCRMAPELSRLQTAYGVAMAALRSEPVAAVDLSPVYLRPSQAEREREGLQG